MLKTTPEVARARRRPLRLAAMLCVLSVALVGAVVSAPGVAKADPLVEVSGFYQEDGRRLGQPDSFSITNEASSEASIVELVLNLSGAIDVVFDPSDNPFQVTSSDDVGFDTQVGFDLTSNTLLKMSFTGFDPGETFSFTVDVDDSGRYTTGADFAGATLSVAFAGSDEAFVALFAANLADSNRADVSIAGRIANPEPSTALLLASGLIGLAINKRRRVT